MLHHQHTTERGKIPEFKVLIHQWFVFDQRGVLVQNVPFPLTFTGINRASKENNHLY